MARLKVQIATDNYRGTLFGPKTNERKYYKIIFADSSEFMWHSMDNEEEMQRARQIFEEKVPQPEKGIYERCSCVLM